MLEVFCYYTAQLFALKGLKAILASMGLYFFGVLNGLDYTVHALLVLMLMDFLLGFYEAWTEKSLSAKKLKDGALKFLLYWAVIYLGSKVDIIVFHKAMEWGFMNFFVVYLGINEALSVIKHLSKHGIKFPARLIESLERYRDTATLP